jgi:AraC-like DNA-binding protein
VAVDVLSDVLLAVRLSGALFYDVDARSPFVAESPKADLVADRVMGEVGHVIGFHVVTDGACWTEAVDGPGTPVRLAAGEMVIFPAGDANIMASDPGMRGTPDWEAYYRTVDELLPLSITLNDDADDEADRCRFVCGYLVCDTRPFNPLLQALPRVVSAPVSAESWQWMARLLDAAVEASGQDTAGREAMLAKLAELMFVEALRGHIATLPPDARSWVAGLRDRQVGAALSAIHAQPAAPWTLERLAREVNMSRSAFAERFTAYVQIPPMQYLARWRLQLAARMLEDGTVTASQAASEVGYQSEAAFSRAFKRLTGVSPGAWRRGRRAVG